MKYSKDLPRKMYLYFISYSESFGAPSFEKFARSIGTTLGQLELFRTKKAFDLAWKECIEIRRDYLIDAALSKRFDASLVKFLITNEFGLEKEGEASDEGLTVKLEVVD